MKKNKTLEKEKNERAKEVMDNTWGKLFDIYTQTVLQRIHAGFEFNDPFEERFGIKVSRSTIITLSCSGGGNWKAVLWTLPIERSA